MSKSEVVPQWRKTTEAFEERSAGLRKVREAAGGYAAKARHQTATTVASFMDSWRRVAPAHTKFADAGSRMAARRDVALPANNTMVEHLRKRMAARLPGLSPRGREAYLSSLRGGVSKHLTDEQFDKLVAQIDTPPEPPKPAEEPPPDHWWHAGGAFGGIVQPSTRAYLADPSSFPQQMRAQEKVMRRTYAEGPRRNRERLERLAAAARPPVNATPVQRRSYDNHWQHLMQHLEGAGSAEAPEQAAQHIAKAEGEALAMRDQIQRQIKDSMRIERPRIPRMAPDVEGLEKMRDELRAAREAELQLGAFIEDLADERAVAEAYGTLLGEQPLADEMAATALTVGADLARERETARQEIVGARSMHESASAAWRQMLPSLMQTDAMMGEDVPDLQQNNEQLDREYQQAFDESEALIAMQDEAWGFGRKPDTSMAETEAAIAEFDRRIAEARAAHEPPTPSSRVPSARVPPQPPPPDDEPQPDDMFDDWTGSEQQQQGIISTILDFEGWATDYHESGVYLDGAGWSTGAGEWFPQKADAEARHLEIQAGLEAGKSRIQVTWEGSKFNDHFRPARDALDEGLITSELQVAALFSMAWQGGPNRGGPARRVMQGLRDGEDPWSIIKSAMGMKVTINGRPAEGLLNRRATELSEIFDIPKEEIRAGVKA